MEPAGLLDSQISQNQVKVKVAILGDSQVGKSSFLKCLSSNNDDPNYLELQQIDIKKKQQILLFQFKKVSESEKEWIAASTCIILMFDVTNKQSFDKIKNHYFPLIKMHLDTSSFAILIGNKLDLAE